MTLSQGQRNEVSSLKGQAQGWRGQGGVNGEATLQHFQPLSSRSNGSRNGVGVYVDFPSSVAWAKSDRCPPRTDRDEAFPLTQQPAHAHTCGRTPHVDPALQARPRRTVEQGASRALTWLWGK